MKRNIKLLSFLALSFVVLFSSCKKKNDPSPEQQRVDELSATWVIVSASVNPDFPAGEVTINFNGSNLTYSVTNLQLFEDNNLNHAGVFSGEGSFSVDPNNTNQVTLSPGGTITIASINKENGNLSINYQSPYQKATDDEQTITLNLELQ
ncbi:hypothetical protein [Marivirga sp.]|uniref:hypothetical protein n=1 Tax=Marivirga sp. TaxID=2018662 RepID=UPI0025FB25E1|nr:hypothetical protein [Marivirga sp.]